MTPRETNADSDSPVRSSINVPPDLVVGLLGSADENLRALERSLSADLHVRGNTVTLSGDAADVAMAERVISELIANGGFCKPQPHQPFLFRSIAVGAYGAFFSTISSSTSFGT